MSIALVYLAAGVSSRFGGKAKQFASIGPNKETLSVFSNSFYTHNQYYGPEQKRCVEKNGIFSHSEFNKKYRNLKKNNLKIFRGKFFFSFLIGLRFA